MDIYEVLKEIILTDERKLKAGVFTDERREMLTDEFDKKIFTLLQRISSIGVKYGKSGIMFYPMFEWADGTRSFAIDDLTDDDFRILYSLKLDELPLLLRTRISEVLWGAKKDYKMADLACSCYYELFLATFDPHKWSLCFKYLSNAIVLAAQINSKKYLAYLQQVYDKIIDINGTDPLFLSLEMINLLLNQRKWTKYDTILPLLDKIITNSENSNIIKQAYNLKTKILLKQGDTGRATENNLNLARYLEERASSVSVDNIQSISCALNDYQEAFHIFRNNGAPGESERIHKKLIELQKHIPSLMLTITSKEDVTKTYQEVLRLFDGLSFEEHIVMLTQITPFLKKDNLKQQVLERASDPLSQLFSSNIISSSGQTIAKMAPIDVNNVDKETETLEKHMHRTALQHEQIHGNNYLKWFHDLLNERFAYTKDDLSFLVSDNPIIPPGRENIFLSGLYLGMTGDIYLSLHILAPQIENLFRYIAEEAGAVMSTLDSKNISEAKLLSKVFDSAELIDCYDNDILFIFKGLLNEKAGANIRNRIAHGLMEESSGNSGEARFFFWWVVKLLSFTSVDCWKILSSERFQKKKEALPHNQQT